MITNKVSLYQWSICFFITLVPIFSWGQNSNELTQLINKLDFIPIEVAVDQGIETVTYKNGYAFEKNGIVWIAADDGLYRYNGNAYFNLTQYYKDHNIIGPNKCGYLHMANDNELWVGTSKGNFVINVENFEVTPIPIKVKPKTQHNANMSKGFFQKGDSMFVASRNGFFLFDIHSKVLIDSFLTNGKPVYPEVSESYINDISFLPNDSAWISTFKGILAMDLNSKQYEIHPYLFKSVFHSSAKGYPLHDKIYYSSWFDGVMSFDTKTKQLTSTVANKVLESRYHLKCYIPYSNEFAVILADEKGVGVFRHQPEQFYFTDPQKNNEPIFLGIQNMEKDPFGYLWISTSTQLYRTKNPVQSTRLEIKPKIELAYLKIEDQNLPFKAFLTQKIFKLTKDQQSVSFKLACSNRDQALHYKYKLHNQNWREVDEDLIVFNDLGYGKNEILIEAWDAEKRLATTAFTFHRVKPFYLTPLFFIILIGTLLCLAYLLYQYQLKNAIEKETIKSDYEKKLMALESSALRSQMNPHFIFNTLNSIKYYAISKSPRETSDFITRFSQLIRQMLENSKNEYITLATEIETMKIYLEIEKIRHRKNFKYQFEIDPKIDLDKIKIPPITLQPFIENAIWHGLMHKDGDRKLDIIIRAKGAHLLCIIKDNGIGRMAAAKIKEGKSDKKKSYGMSITKDRIKNFNTKYDKDYQFEIIDLFNDQDEAIGTEVRILIVDQK